MKELRFFQLGGKMKSLTIMLGLISFLVFNSQLAFAKSAEAFTKRFQIIRSDDGSLVGIRDRTMPVKFSVKPDFLRWPCRQPQNRFFQSLELHQ